MTWNKNIHTACCATIIRKDVRFVQGNAQVIEIPEQYIPLGNKFEPDARLCEGLDTLQKQIKQRAHSCVCMVV